MRRTPHGVRGLKWEVKPLVTEKKDVAPRMGCVD